MTLRKKIISGFIIVFTVGFSLGITGLITINQFARMSDELQQLQRTGSSISGVLNAHYNWRQALTETVLFEKEFTGSLNADACALGTWRNSEEAKSITDPEVLSIINQLTSPHTNIHNEAKEIVSMINNNETEKAREYFNNNVLPDTDKTIKFLTDMENRYNEILKDKNTEIINFQFLMIIVICVLMVVALVVCLTAVILIIKSIMKPIRMITQAAGTISTGDLNVSLSYHIRDEIGELTESFQKMITNTKKQADILESLANGDLTNEIILNSEKDIMNAEIKKMLHNLNSMFKKINQSAVQVSSGSQQMAEGSQMLAQGATEQAASIEQLSASIAGVDEKTKENSMMAEEAASLSVRMKTSVENGSEHMQKMVQAVKEINDANQSINKIIKVIDDIAFQTNILALNAAVEAARAGEHGKGFAVVADEVRNLASKSSVAAKDTSTLIANSMQKAELGVSIADETATALDEIMADIVKSSDIVNKISESSKEQSVSISQINDGINQVAQVVQQNSATAEQSAASSEEISSQSDILQQLVLEFKLKR